MADQLDVTQPDVTVGYAMVDKKNCPFPDTVCRTIRGAKVNALVSIWSLPVYAWDTDAKINAEFSRLAGGDYRISAVAIEALTVTGK